MLKHLGKHELIPAIYFDMHQKMRVIDRWRCVIKQVESNLWVFGWSW